MEKTFTISSKVVKNILDQYKELLEKQKQNTKDCFHLEYIEQLQKLDMRKLKEILETVFYSSLEKEEGKQHHFSVMISPPESRFSELLKGFTHKHYVGYFNDVSSFETPVKVSSLHKLAPAFEFTNRKLRLWFYKGNKVKIWGFANCYFDNSCLEIRTFLPGQLVIQLTVEGFPKIRYLMNLSRTECVRDDFPLSELLFTEDELKKRKDLSDRENWIRYHHRFHRRYGFLIDVINKITNHGHGGILLIVPDENIKDVLEESIKKPIPCSPDTKYDFIKRKLIDEENEYVNSDRTGNFNKSLPWLFNKDANFLGQITAVDGATIITKSFDVIAFGAKIESKKLKSIHDKLEYVWIKEPFVNFLEHQQEISDLGGTRHQSVAQFVFDQREKNVFAIVASQDGKTSIIFWDDKRKMVTQFRHAEYLFFGIKL
jgi:hypothetical protein